MFSSRRRFGVELEDQIAASPGRTSTCTEPTTAHHECGWKHAERETHRPRPPKPTTIRKAVTTALTCSAFSWKDDRQCRRKLLLATSTDIVVATTPRSRCAPVRESPRRLTDGEERGSISQVQPQPEARPQEVIMIRSLLVCLLVAPFVLSWASPAAVVADDTDGAVGGVCRSIWNPGAPSGGDAEITCSNPCAAGCDVKNDGGSPARHYCKCSGSSEPACCHLYREDYGGGVWAGPYAEGVCGDHSGDTPRGRLAMGITTPTAVWPA